MVRLMELGPHPERQKKETKNAFSAENEPLLNVEVKISPIRTHHYIISGIVAGLIGLSATYGALEAGNVAINHLKPETTADALTASYSGQGSDDNDDLTGLDEEEISGSYTILNSRKLPNLSSQYYLVGDVETGDVVLEKNSNTRTPMASVTKIMTGIIDLENLNQREYATVTPATQKYYGVVGELVPNEIIRVSDLIYPLLIVSSNVAAEVIAYHEGREEFLTKMNEKAHEIGMLNTHYGDASGLSPDSYSTAFDLFRLAQYEKKVHPELLDIGRIREYSILGHTWINKNHQLVYTSFAGGKNGYTVAAAKTTVSFFNLSFNPKNKNEKRSIVIVLLKTNDREGDIRKLLNYLAANVRYDQKPLDVGTPSAPGPQEESSNPDN